MARPPRPRLAQKLTEASACSRASFAPVPELRPFYDVIVVGAGSAGAVVAQTLAALLPSKAILVIESGPDLDTTAPVSREPANSANLFVAQSDGRRQQPPQVFTRKLVPPLGKAQVPNEATPPSPSYIQGRGWGGSGAINGLVCAPGKPADYDRWANEYGCIGWAWADLAPAFANLQSRLFLSTPSMYQAADHALLAAYTSLTSDNLQLTPAALSISHGRRKLLGLMEPETSNLLAVYGIDVVRILTSGTNVCGVQLADGTELEATQIIVSAGAIGSPLLLQRSGIGRPSVGQNLHDHTSVAVTLQLHGALSEQHVPTNQPIGEGLTPTNVIIESFDHIQILPVSLLPSDPTLGVWMAAPFQAIHGRGSVIAQSDGTTLVQFDSFSDERDRAELRNAARLLGQLLEQLHIAPSTQIAATPVDPHLAEQLRTLIDDELDNWVLNNQGSYYHAAGTCRMGAVDDPRSVVDPTCAVLGWSNISVIDASIFPDLPMANPYLPTVAVAQLAATRLATNLRA
jgi:5-(hydroxymethyl)furfural/furfural oxidase